MSAPSPMVAGAWAAVLSLNVDEELTAGLVPSRVSEGFASGVRALGCNFPVREGAINPVTTVARVFARDRYVVTCSASFIVSAPVEGRAVNLAFATAFKNAGAGSGLSVQRIADGLNFDRNIAEAFSWSPAIAQCSADYRHTGETPQLPQAAVTSALGSTAAAAGTGRVIASDNAALIGQRPTALGGTIFDDVSGFWGSIPTGVKVLGTVAVVTLAVGAVGYTARALK